MERLKVISQWLLILPIVMLILFACGQLGILTSRTIAEANTQSRINANYGPWSYVLIHSLNPDIIKAILQDKPLESGVVGMIPSTSQGSLIWVETTPGPENLVPPTPAGKDLTPSSTPPTQNTTPVEAQPSISPTPTSTNPLPTHGSETPSTPTSSPTPIPTDIDTATPPPTATPNSSDNPDCASLVVRNIGFVGNTFQFLIENLDPAWETYLRHMNLAWPTDGSSGFDAFYMGDYSSGRFYDPGSPIYTSPINAEVDPERPLSDWMGTQSIQSIFHQLPEGDFRLTLTFSYWYTDNLCEIVVQGTNSSSSMDPVTYWMTSTNAFGGYKLVTSHPSIPERSGLIYMEFRSDPFAEAISIEGGQVAVHFYASNSSDKSSTVGFILKPSIGFRILGTGEMQIPANTTEPRYFTKTFHTNPYDFSIGNQLGLVITTEESTQIHWGGDWEAARVIVPPLSH